MTVRTLQNTHVPAWAGQALVTCLMATITGAALAAIVMSTPGEAPGELPVPLVTTPNEEPAFPSTFIVPSGPTPIMVYVVGGGERGEVVKSALEGESFIRQLSGEPRRRAWVLEGDGLDINLLRQVLSADDAMMNSPQWVVLIDLR